MMSEYRLNRPEILKTHLHFHHVMHLQAEGHMCANSPASGVGAAQRNFDPESVLTAPIELVAECSDFKSCSCLSGPLDATSLEDSIRESISISKRSN